MLAQHTTRQVLGHKNARPCSDARYTESRGPEEILRPHDTPSQQRHTPEQPTIGSPWPPSGQGARRSDPPQIVRPCVVLASASEPLPEAFHRVLKSAGLAPRVEHDPRMAMAEVCLLRRESRQRRGITSESQELAPLILVTTPQAEERVMLEAMLLHVPDVPVMQFDGAALQRVHTPDASDVSDPPVAVQPPKRPEVTDDELNTLLQPRPNERPPHGGPST